MKPKIVALFLVSLATLALYSVYAADKSDKRTTPGHLVYAGFCTGQDYIEMSEDDKALYVMGAFDGMLAATLFQAPINKVEWLVDSAKGMTNVQIAAILSKYLKDNPAQWHMPLNTLMHKAMFEMHMDGLMKRMEKTLKEIEAQERADAKKLPGDK